MKLFIIIVEELLKVSNTVIVDYYAIQQSYGTLDELAEVIY